LHVITKKTAKNWKVAAIGLVLLCDAEYVDAQIPELNGTLVAATGEALGKHICHPNTLYTVFWSHTNKKNEDVDVPGIDVPKK
jgi:hypothetical protein